MSDFGGAVKRSETFDFAVIGIPYDRKSSFRRGAAGGPAAVRRASTGAMINSATELGADLSADAVLVDRGDVEVTGGFDRVAERIERRVGEVLNLEAVPLIIGGDHSVTYPAVRAVSRRYRPLNVLYFDAHPDLYPEYGGDPFSHACPLCRILEQGLAARAVLVGIRAANSTQRAQADRYDVRMIEMKDLQDDLCLRFDSPLYVSFDLDALDPAFAPGVSHLEAGGMTTRQALGILQRLEAEIVGMDVVELNADRDTSGITAAAAVKLLMEAAGKIIVDRRAGKAAG
jgi:agmatinase